MTTFEHALVGVTLALATRLDRHFGWPIVALAGAAAVLPDWDGLTLVAGPAAFDRAHRVWGHSLLTAPPIAAIFAVLASRNRWFERLHKELVRHFPKLLAQPAGGNEAQQSAALAPPPSRGSVAVWIVVAVIATLSHLAADLVVSGHRELGTWPLQLFWPISDRPLAFPLLSWGDPGATLLFAASMFAMLRWPARRQSISIAVLGLVAADIAVRGITSPL